MNSYQRTLEERKRQHLLRTLPLPPEGIDFYSNDSLGLAKSPKLQAAIEEELKACTQKNGSTGSRLLSGNTEYAEKVEQKIANFHNAESALIYASGYTANLGLISSLSTRDTTLICDELIHASLIDGARLGYGKKVRFRHNDLEDLREKVTSTEGQKIVIVESVYSMDGDISPLAEIAKICESNDAMLIVDEAHAMAVLGENGEGLVQKWGLENKILARIMTYGKGPGIHGAAVVGPQWLKDYQVNFSRSMIFSTAPPAHHYASIAAMYDQLSEMDQERKSLQDMIQYFVKKREASDGNWINSHSQIQSLIIPGNEQVVRLGNKLQEAAINALPIRKPSVAEGSERIRFCLHSYNTKEEIDLLFKIIN
ncbi:MAG: 8-amino-7-oxononanoate synthase [Ekhidna sp.]|uniref:aminotransferase class I/II-fold pyridoxal phosphate-dependent enzyme n=1 Tax=Ekhidna sp. TaxID=2608089 RepID=UPI0032EDADC0